MCSCGRARGAGAPASAPGRLDRSQLGVFDAVQLQHTVLWPLTIVFTEVGPETLGV